jgi:RNA polymerase sigma-70 factor, ECF subfamily
MAVNVQSEVTTALPAAEALVDFESVFRTHYERIARVIARVVGDPARAEELAAELFLKLWRSPVTQLEHAEGWLYKTAVRRGLDELRKRTRRARYESVLRFVGETPTPEEVHVAREEQERVRLVLATLASRQAEILILRCQDLSYEELASALNLNPASVGTLLSRAQKAFRKEYIQRYGEE